MYCAHLSLVNFRNYARLELDIPSGISVFIGENAQGKSNLLEALYILATTKSFRAGADRELINWRVLGSDLSYARLFARVERKVGPVRLEAVLREDPKLLGNGNSSNITKRLKLNDVPRRAIDVVGAVNVVMFSPQDIELVAGPPLLRRRYLDVTISQVDHRYVQTLAEYNRILVQRNNLLRQIRDRRARTDQLFPWNHELVRTGSYVIQQRRQTLDLLADHAQGYHRQLTGRQEVLQIEYRPSIPLSDSQAPIEVIEEAFRAQLRTVLPRETAAGQSILGPHRDDLAFIVDGHSMNSFGSRGQQRTVALALKLAEAEYQRAQIDDLPILLLDDVLSELDARRREHVLATIVPGQQVVLTGTDLTAFDVGFRARASLFTVFAGSIEAQREEESEASLYDREALRVDQGHQPNHGR